MGTSRWITMTQLFDPFTIDLEHSSLRNITFTSSPLEVDMEITGYPTLLLWASTVHDRKSNQDAGDIFVCLQCVEENKTLTYVTEGALRLKHRHYFTTSIADQQAYDELSMKIDDPITTSIPHLPKRTFRSEYLKEGPLGVDNGKIPEPIWISLQPVSFLFRRGQCISISIYGSDVNHFSPCADYDYDLNIWLANPTSSDMELSAGCRLFLPVIPTG